MADAETAGPGTRGPATEPPPMMRPTQCVLWTDPEPVVADPIAVRFELLDIFAEDSHYWRYLLRCRECGQLYFFEFYEEIDWADGGDPSWVTYIPVRDAADVATLCAASSPQELLAFTPRLQHDRPKGAKEPTVRWIGRGGDGAAV